jgi:serine protease AprX
MNKFLLIPLILFSSGVFSQNRYVIHLTDKNNSPYSVSNPSAFLSARSIARRAAHNIAIDQSDIPVNAAYVTAIANEGPYIMNVSKWFNTVTILTNDSAVLANIQALPFVDNIKVCGRPSTGGSDGKFEKLLSSADMQPAMALRRSSLDYGYAAHQIQMLNGDYLHNIGYKGENMVIAVLDAGFLNVDTLPCFASLRNTNRILGTWDFVNNETDVYQDDAHGAEVMSLMASDLPGQIVGTAPNASYWLLRTEDANSEYIIEEYNWASGAEFADSVGADVINTSLGYTQFWDSTQNHTYADMDGNTAPVTIAADMAAAKGILVECSAGNEGASPWHYISAPADGDSVMTTGAVDSTELYAPFSSTGPSFDGRIKPSIAAQGMYAFVCVPWDGSIVAGSGTSFSGPIMSGLAACLWQAFPNMTNMQIINAIEQSASQALNPDSLLGYGIPDFQNAASYLAIKEYGPGYNSDQLVSVYPVPFSENFTFYFFSAHKQTVAVELFDMLGKQVTSRSYAFNGMSLNRQTINPRSLAKGVYVLRIHSEEGNFSQQVIKY